ncbi:MAG TPA: DEAD/DEAH box helicase [Burkholderiaceae bacterium]|jgi:superfamily II DNA or RNA helicase
MVKRKQPGTLFNLGDRQLDMEQVLATLRARHATGAVPGAVPGAAAPSAAPEPATPASAVDCQHVLDALLLTSGIRGANGLSTWLKSQDIRREGGRAFHPVDVTACLQALHRTGIVTRSAAQPVYALETPAHAERLQALLRQPADPPHWKRLAWLMAGGDGHFDGRLPPVWRIQARSRPELVCLMRLLAFSGLSVEDFDEAVQQLPLAETDIDVLAGALLQPWLPEAVAAMQAPLRNALAASLLDFLPSADMRGKALRDWLFERFDANPDELAPTLRAQLAQTCLEALDLPRAEQLLQGLSGAICDLLPASRLLQAGDWPGAAAAYEATLKTMRQQLKQKRGMLGLWQGRLYLISLLAQDRPQAWETARKYAIAESGSRKPSPHDWWGMWAHAIGVRLGEESLLPEALACPAQLMAREHYQLSIGANQLLLAAWLGRQPEAWTSRVAGELVQALQAQGQHWLAAYVDQACTRLELGDARYVPAQRPPIAPWLGAPREAWRDALATILAMGVSSVAKKPQDEPELAWQLTLDKQGRVTGVEALERSTSARGQTKLKAVSWARLKKLSGLQAHDEAVLRHVERPAYGGTSSYQIDVAEAAFALCGHPALMLADAPGQWVEMVEAQAELEVVRRPASGGGEQFEFRIEPSPLASDPPSLGVWVGNNFEAERLKRDSLRVLHDGPQRARLVRFNTAQRRVAELVAQGWRVPASASAELGAALQVLSAHFQLQSDAAAGQLVAGDSRLRAQLTPLGEGLRLQLVAQPFGAFGPVVTPGEGRTRLMCMHEGQSLATERELEAEAEHRRAVLQALPFLDPEQGADSPWLLDDPESALRAVEVLPALPGVAGLDWPKGKPLRVTPVQSDALNVQISSGRDWLGLSGEARVDEQRVLSLQTLMALADASRSRFVSLGEGEYLALSERLRQQLRDLQALAQHEKGKKDQLQLPQASASWLDETLADMQVNGDKPWRVRMDALAEAAALQPSLPPGLRAELRSYQHEGYAWMSRLAHAGLGACLADDMGLGKTVQTLAMLVARAELGPALVLAPTSVCANWLAEAATFAPGLRCTLYGEGADRAALIGQAGPGDVVIASYALAQIDAGRFADKDWASLVMDEAQALKNAATKRAKSVAEFKAGFRLALSGTPVENRLTDLWSIMNLINPGLLGSVSQFGERFAGPIERRQDATVRGRLRRLVSPFLLRRTKAQVLQDLPPRTEIVHLVEPSVEERNFLEALRRNAQAKVAAAAEQDKGANMQVLAELMRLRRAACDPRLVAPEAGLVGAKMVEFERIVNELVAGGHKALVFSQFTDYLKLLAKQLDHMQLSYQYLDGSTPAAERAKRVAAFQKGEGELFLISLKAGGFGLNLTMADYVLIVDPWWNPAAEDQAMGRAHRMGQQRPVTVYRLVTAGSVEERIIELHRDKRGLADGILEGQDEAQVLDAKALAALLRD